MSDQMCPHCGELLRPGKDGLTPYHDYPRPCRAVCPGSKQIPRCAESDGRPLWNGESNPHFYQNTEQAENYPLQPGDYIITHWSDDDGTEQSAAGFFDHYQTIVGERYLVLDWGYGIDMDADNFRWERAEPPAGGPFG